MLDGADSPPNGNFDTSWELPSPINTGSASLRNRPDFPFSPLTSNSYLNSHRTSQHRRRNTHSPSNLARTDSTSSHQPPRTNHEPLPDFPQETFNPTELDSSAFQVYPQSQPQQGSRLNQRTQLPGIDTAFPNYGFTDRPPSRFSWDAAAEDSLFVNADLWPDFNNSELNTVDANGFVDLTADSSPAHIMPPMTRKRRASATPVAAPSSPPSRSAKRRKTEDAGIKVEEPKVEKLDLVEVADDSGLSQVLEQQQVAAIKEQQGTQGNQAIRLSSLQCIICLEPMKDITVTHCGKSLLPSAPYRQRHLTRCSLR